MQCTHFRIENKLKIEILAKVTLTFILKIRKSNYRDTTKSLNYNIYYNLSQTCYL